MERDMGGFYGTDFTEIDKVLLQIQRDYEAQDKWHGYAQNNDYKTFMLLFGNDCPNMATKRYEQNDEFYVRMFSGPDMMKLIIDSIEPVLYETLRRGVSYLDESTMKKVAEDIRFGE